MGNRKFKPWIPRTKSYQHRLYRCQKHNTAVNYELHSLHDVLRLSDGITCKSRLGIHKEIYGIFFRGKKLPTKRLSDPGGITTKHLREQQSHRHQNEEHFPSQL